MPPLVTLVEDLRTWRRKHTLAEPPLLTPPPPRREAAVPPSALDLRTKWRAELRAYHRSRTGTVEADTLAAIDAEVAVVGEHETRALAFIEANPDADYGRISKEFVDSWIQALVKPSPRVSSEVVEASG
jgi:hypothetical protein